MAGAVARLKALALRIWSPALVAYAIAGGVAAASFLSTMILARVSGPAVIGQYALAMSTATLLASFAMLGLGLWSLFARWRGGLYDWRWLHRGRGRQGRALLQLAQAPQAGHGRA